MNNTTMAPPRRSIVKVLGRAIRRELTPWRIVSYALLIVLSALYIGPLAMLVNTSFKTLREYTRDPAGMATEIRWDNYEEAWEAANFSSYLMNSVLYASSATIIYVIFAVFVAFPITRRYVRGSNWLLTLYLIALFLPPALIPQFQLMLNVGLYNTQIGYIMLFLVNPIGIIILVNYIKSIPVEIDEAAALDGCGYFRFVLVIVLPLIRPAIATIAVLHAIGIWNELILATVYLSNEDFYPITRGMIAFEGQYTSDKTLLVAAVVMMMTPMIILFLLLQRYIMSGLTQGSVKG